MKIESALCKYTELPSPAVGTLGAILSPDGWENTRYERITDPYLNPNEIIEFTDVVQSFIRTCNTQRELNRFIRKHGNELDAVTSGFIVCGCLMDYVVRVAGCAVTFEAHRKEHQ